MEFKKFSAGAVKYGNGEKPSLEDIQEPNVNFCDPNLKEILNRPDDD